MTVAALGALVCAYFTAKAERDSWEPGRRVNIRGAVRANCRAKARRAFDAADTALRAAVGVDHQGKATP